MASINRYLIDFNGTEIYKRRKLLLMEILQYGNPENDKIILIVEL